MTKQKKRSYPHVDLGVLAALKPNERNRALLEWLGDDESRNRLFGLINNEGTGELEFPSRDAAARECDCAGVEEPRQELKFGHEPVTLITSRSKIEEILKNAKAEYASRIYAELGGGSFMLALDPTQAMTHEAQRTIFGRVFPHQAQVLIELSQQAVQAGSVTALRAPDFDLVNYAEQAALRYCQKLFGYSRSDYRLLESSLRAAYRALVYQVLGRHFATDVVAIPEAKAAMGKLLTRTAALIDAYATCNEDDDELKGCKDHAVPAGFKPVLQKLADADSELNAEQRAIVAMGSAIGSVGNVQAAVCIAVQALFAKRASWDQARALARKPTNETPERQYQRWKQLLAPFLRDNPPIPFLPRLKVDAAGKSVGEVILALGGGTCGGPDDDPLIWGLPPGGKHNCLGQELAWPLIIEIVRQVMALPGLAERLDPEDARPFGLKKRWGFACESYPLTHRREDRVAQQSLNVAMRLKAPIRDNADRVREVIRAGAPRIEEALREARHVHFAWFELIESDSVLLLHTVYDGPFEAYIQHFALAVGDMFDLLFECIEDAPPMPVNKFPNEFVAHILRYNRQPLAGYFFSAYPRSEVARIVRAEMAGQP